MFSIYFTALKSLAVKETNRYLRIWVQTLVPPVITTSKITKYNEVVITGGTKVCLHLSFLKNFKRILKSY